MKYFNDYHYGILGWVLLFLSLCFDGQKGILILILSAIFLVGQGILNELRKES